MNTHRPGGGTAQNILDVRTPYCVDCGHPNVKVHWGGGSRCQPCSDAWHAKVHAKRLRDAQAKTEADARHVCGQDIEGAAELCQKCCEHEHDPDEGMMCLNCDKEWDGP